MPPYLLKHRLRHIRSITLSNVTLGEGNISKLRLQFLSCFVTLETYKGKPLYVSEIQQASLRTIQFNELPPQDSPLTHVVFKIIVRAPQKLIPLSSSSVSPVSDDKELWFVFRKYSVELNKLKRINPDDVIDCYNVPIFEMLDGFYVLPDVPIVSISCEPENHGRTLSACKVKPSFSFNSVLKLTKIHEYLWQVRDEASYTSHRLDNLMQCAHEENGRVIESIKRSNDQLESDIEKKKAEITRLNDLLRLPKQARQTSLVSQNPSINDYYGNTYPDLIQIKNRLEILRSKKLLQIVSIFQQTSLFDEKIGFVGLNDETSLAIQSRIKLNLLRKEILLDFASRSDSDRRLINSSLGYYSLLIFLTAKEIFKIPLPFSLQYYGSTSIVENDFPLYLEESSGTKIEEDFSKAVSYFNRNIIQVIQHLESHPTP